MNTLSLKPRRWIFTACDRLRDRGMQVAFDHLGVDGPAHTYVPGVVYLNIDHPWIREHAQNEVAMTGFAVPVVATYWVLCHPDELPCDLMERCDTPEECIAKLTAYLLSRLYEPPPAMYTR